MKQTYFNTRQSCPGCSSTNVTELIRKSFSSDDLVQYLNSFYNKQGKVEHEYLSGANYILNSCKDCSLIYQKDIPNEFLMAKLYDEWIDPKKAIESNNKKVDMAYYKYFAKEISDLINVFDKRPKDIKVFDFGMGWANWCLIAKGFGCDVHGAELSKARIEHAKKNGIKIVEWDDIPTYEFDLINTEQVFEHIPNPLEMLKHLSKGLKKGGVIKISVPNGNNIPRKLKNPDWSAPKGSMKSMNAVAPLEHINCYNHNSLVQMGIAAGMKPVGVPIKSEIVSGVRNALFTAFKILFRRVRFSKTTCIYLTNK